MQEERLRFGEFELDSGRSELWRDGQAVDLQALPLRLLVYLAERAGRVVSRTELLAEVWEGTVVGDAALSTALKQLRTALGDRDREPPWVVTLRGRGVRFDAPVEVAATEPRIVRPEPDRPPRSRLRRAGRFLSAALVFALGVGGWAWLSWPAPLGLLLDAAGLLEPEALPPPTDKPSIAILPFDDLSEDEDQQYLADAIVDDLTTQLAREPSLLVIARTSSETYRDEPADARRIGRELGVRYLLEGSIRRDGERLRVNVQLIEAASGHHVWSEQYDRTLDDLFAVQDELMHAIQSALLSGIVEDSYFVKARRRAISVEAYREYAKAMSGFLSARKQGVLVDARRHARRAIELDPEYSDAYEVLAFTYWAERAYGWVRTNAPYREAEVYARRALDLDPEGADGLNVLALIALNEEDLEGGLELANRLVTARPHYATSHIVRAVAFVRNGHFQEALRSLRVVQRLDPRGPAVRQNYAEIYLQAGFDERGVELFEEHAASAPDLVHPHLILAAWYEQDGQHERAREHIDHVLRIAPDYDVDWAVNQTARFFEVDSRELLARAGLPRGPGGDEVASP